jgi:adenylate kinase
MGKILRRFLYLYFFRYPREVKQGEQFENEIAPCRLVIFFDVDEDTLIKRCLKRAETSGRSDDNIETIKKRLQTFNIATAPVVDYYRKKGKLVHIKAEGTIEEIFAEVCKHLDKAISQY